MMASQSCFMFAFLEISLEIHSEYYYCYHSRFPSENFPGTFLDFPPGIRLGISSGSSSTFSKGKSFFFIKSSIDSLSNFSRIALRDFSQFFSRNSYETLTEMAFKLLQEFLRVRVYWKLPNNCSRNVCRDFYKDAYIIAPGIIAETHTEFSFGIPPCFPLYIFPENLPGCLYRHFSTDSYRNFT